MNLAALFSRLLQAVLLVFLISPLYAQKTIQERLGYPRDTKLLIIHADDLGLSHAEDSASILAMERGSVSSGSIMVPCPWFAEMLSYAEAHPRADLGLHLTLTSEWRDYKWAPVAGSSQVPSLVNRLGYFYSSTDSLYQYAKPQEVEIEIRAQIEKALKAGLHPTHLDAHMACLFASPDMLKILVKMGRAYHLPVLLNGPAFKQLFNLDISDYTDQREVPVDQLFMAYPADFAGGMENYYRRVFQSLRPGLSCILLHAAFNGPEMQAITVAHPDYGAAWRQADFDFFHSSQCQDLLRNEGIRVITWKEVRDKLFQTP